MVCFFFPLQSQDSFHPLKGVFHRAEAFSFLLNLMSLRLLLCTVLLVSNVGALCLVQPQRFSLTVFSKSFTDICFILKSVIHFELSFCVRQ